MRRKRGENGFTLLGVMLLAAVMAVFLAVAIPRITQEIRRDRELECIHRGKQYARAIRLYYRHFGNFPTDITQLENSNNIRFLRKRYQDPITGGYWKLVFQGEVKPDLLEQGREIFGRPFLQSTGTPPPGTIMGLTAGVPTSGFGGNGGVTHLIDPVSGQPVSPSAPGSTQSATAPSDSLVSSGSNTGSTPKTRRIVGVCSLSAEKSIRIYKKQSYYNDWQFIYDPATDGIAGGAQPGVNGPSPGAGTIAPVTTPTPTPTAQQ